MTALLVVYLAFLLLFAQHIQAKKITYRNIKEIGEKNGREMEKQLPNLEDKNHNRHDKKVFNIDPGKNAHIRFSFHPPKGRSPSTGMKKKEPEYFLNFVFDNYHNPKKSLDRDTILKKLKMRRTGKRLLPNGMSNPYKFFPLKGEDM